MHQSSDQLRCRAAERILKRAVDAVEPAGLVRAAWEQDTPALDAVARLRVAAVGKAAAAMYRGFVEAVSRPVDEAVVCTPTGAPVGDLAGAEHHVATHPLPGPESLAFAERLRRLAQRSGPDDYFVLLLSGGASSLMESPPDGLGADEVRETIRALLLGGATIHELNCVRRRLCTLKGGGLAAALGGASASGWILSDVIDDAEEVIGSGPLTADRADPRLAREILRRYRLEGRTPRRVLEYLDAVRESPVSDEAFARVRTRRIGNGWTAARAARAAAVDEGYDAEILSPTLAGEAREAGRFLAATARVVAGSATAGRALVCCGETQVTVRGDGVGGRNQELALSAALGIDGLDGVLIAAMDTDGLDGPTHAAGAFATGRTVARARALGIDCERALDTNDSHPVFARLDDLIVSGPTGTNVSDLQLLLIGDPE